jgi:hypothetical protein
MSSVLPCRNCSAPAPGKFCGECGQSTALHPPTAREFLHEFIGHHVALEGKLWVTLRKLLFAPGSLTVEYFAGRKLRYINPLRLYLTVSLILFAVLGLIDPKVNVATFDPKTGTVSAPLSHEESMRLAQKSADDLSFAPDWAKQHLRQFLELPAEQQRARMGRAFVSYSPYAFFLLLPALALLLKLLYRKRGVYYGEHLVCALHLQTAGFIFALADMVLVPPAAQSVVQLVLVVYSTVALRRVYGGRWWAAFLRVLVLAMIYTLLLSLMVMLMLTISVLL